MLDAKISALETRHFDRLVSYVSEPEKREANNLSLITLMELILVISVELPEIMTQFTVADFLKRDKDWLKDESGLYMLYDKHGNLLYIGITKNFRDRLLSHIRGKSNSFVFYRQIYKIVLYRVRDKTDREIYESWSIRELNPIYNRAKTVKNQSSVWTSERINELEQRRTDVLEQIREINDDYNVFEFDDEYHEDDFYSLGNELKKRQVLDELNDDLSEIISELRGLRASQSS